MNFNLTLPVGLSLQPNKYTFIYLFIYSVEEKKMKHRLAELAAGGSNQLSDFKRTAQ